MPSQLTGRSVKLEWRAFQGPPPAGKAKELEGLKPGKGTFLAATYSDFTIRYGSGTRPLFDRDGSGFVLRDEVTIAAVFNGAKSWKVIDHLSDKGKEWLLDHEQGHYNISALMARDCFIDMMQLKSQVFATEADGVAAANGVFTKYHDALDKVQNKYDWDTNHGEWFVPSFGPASKGSEQLRWESYISRAFTEERSPTVTAPDGATYKKRLMDIARAGIVGRNETSPF